METLSEYFRQAREAAGLSLDELSKRTRIGAEFLIALEEGNFARLPDQVFVKGFVRSYARSLGLNEEEAIRRFSESAGSFYEKQFEREQLRVKQAEDDRRRRANRKVVVVAVGMAMLAVALLFTREQSTVVTPPSSVSLHGNAAPAALPKSQPAANSSDSREPVPSVSAKSELPTSGPSAPVAGSAAEGVGGEAIPFGAGTSEPAPGMPATDAGSIKGGQMVLDVEALELTWVHVKIDDGSQLEALLRRGDRAQWKAMDRFSLTLGNAGGVKVELNGKPQGPFGPKRKVARDVVLTRDNL